MRIFRLGEAVLRVWIDASVDKGLTVFGMSAVERHVQAVARLKGISEVCIDGGEAMKLPEKLARKVKIVFRKDLGSPSQRLDAYLKSGTDPVLAVSGDTMVDQRLFEFALTREPGFAAIDKKLGMLSLAPQTSLPEAATVEALAAALVQSGTVRELPQSEFPTFIRRLRRDMPYYLLPVRSEKDRAAAEHFMFWANYKGSTDLFTRYVYPFFVWHLVRPLAHWRVHPNVVSLFNVFLGIAAVPAFAMREYVIGFVCAYLMSVLDSVDGKLARLTYTDTQLGTRLDHGLDLIHPPFWYLAWAWAVAAGNLNDPVLVAAVMMVIVYILDRLAVKVYTATFQRALYAHAKIDAFIRSFIARRNINLPIFLVGVILGFEREAFLLIVAWQVATLVWHTCRIGWILMFDSEPAAKTA
jgi:phosphatidylglycerophosphate synthase